MMWLRFHVLIMMVLYLIFVSKRDPMCLQYTFESRIYNNNITIQCFFLYKYVTSTYLYTMNIFVNGLL